MARRVYLPRLRPNLIALIALLAGCGEPRSETSWRLPFAEAVAELWRAPDPPQWRIAPFVLRVRAAPGVGAAVVGHLAADQPFEVFAWGEADGACGAPGWARVARGGWSCMTRTESTASAPVTLPELIAFDPPRPEETADYFRSGVWPRDDANEDPVVPYVYAKRWLRWAGREYADVDAYLRDDPIATLSGQRKYHFDEVIETERGTVLGRGKGRVVPLDGVWVYPVSRLRGVDLALDPPPDGSVPGWAGHRKGTAVFAFPEAGAEVSWTAGWQHPVWVEPDAAPGWLRVIDRTDTHPGGWVPDGATVRWWRDVPPPNDLGDMVWVDVDLEHQVLALRRGALTTFVTLVSTGTSGDKTPLGLFPIMDKAGWWDMASRPGASDPYHVESVPWVTHFWPRYALHGTFWHDGFGHVRSHGCVNLALHDAKRVFDAVGPELPPGWWTVNATEENPGSVVRVRTGERQGRDRR